MADPINKIIYSITNADLNNLTAKQWGIETGNDSLLGFKVMGYKDADGGLHKLLAKSETIVTPKIVVVSDGTSALNFTKADGTTSVAVIDTTNNRVGIGITTPTVPLDVRTTASNTVALAVATTGTSAGGVSIALLSNENDAGGTITRAAIKGTRNTDDNGDLLLFTRTSGSITEKARIDKTGNMGIGTTAPVSMVHLSKATAPTVTIDNTVAAGGTPQVGIINFRAKDDSETLVSIGNISTGIDNPAGGGDAISSYMNIAISNNTGEKQAISINGTGDTSTIYVGDSGGDGVITLYGSTGIGLGNTVQPDSTLQVQSPAPLGTASRVHYNVGCADAQVGGTFTRSVSTGVFQRKDVGTLTDNGELFILDTTADSYSYAWGHISAYYAASGYWYNADFTVTIGNTPDLKNVVGLCVGVLSGADVDNNLNLIMASGPYDLCLKQRLGATTTIAYEVNWVGLV